MAGVKAAIGVEHILFGSDWPHAEGLAEPRSFAEDLSRHGFTEAEIRTVMSDNGRVLAQRAA
jgi:predicted TIM-barrel fold metal-dependent hydrolase